MVAASRATLIEDRLRALEAQVRVLSREVGVLKHVVDVLTEDWSGPMRDELVTTLMEAL